jgi:hypothetical protein
MTVPISVQTDRLRDTPGRNHNPHCTDCGCVKTPDNTYIRPDGSMYSMCRECSRLYFRLYMRGHRRKPKPINKFSDFSEIKRLADDIHKGI